MPSIDSVGGAQKMARFVIENSIDLSNYRVFLIPQQNRAKELAFTKEIEIIRLNNCVNESESRFKRLIKRLFATFEIRKIIRKISPNLIVIFGITSSSLLALNGLDYPKVYCERGDPFSYPNYLQKMLKKCLASYRFIVLQTDNAKKYFDFIDDSKKIVIPNPCIISRPPIVNGNFDSNILISAGRLVNEKRFDFIIKIFARLKEKNPMLILNIFGNGEKKDFLQKLIHQYKLEDSVFIRPGTSNILDEISKAKLFLFASTFEGVPNVIIETCGMGIPCVCTNCSPGGADFLTIGGTVGGKLVDIDDFDGFLSACLELLHNKKKYTEYSSTGIEFRDRFSETRISKMWRDFIVRNVFFDSKTEI